MNSFFSRGALAVGAVVCLWAAGCGGDEVSQVCKATVEQSDPANGAKVTHDCTATVKQEGTVGEGGVGGQGGAGAGGMGSGGDGGGGKEPDPLACQSYADCAPLPGGVVCHFNDCVAGKCEAVESPDKSFCYTDVFGAGSCFSGTCKPPAPANCQSQESCSLWSDCGIPQDGQCWYPSCDAGCCVIHACP